MAQYLYTRLPLVSEKSAKFKFVKKSGILEFVKEVREKSEIFLLVSKQIVLNKKKHNIWVLGNSQWQYLLGITAQMLILKVLYVHEGAQN